MKCSGWAKLNAVNTTAEVAARAHKLTLAELLLALEADIHDVPEHILQTLGGPRATAFLTNPSNHYWMRAWAARALCHAWHPLAFEALIRALESPHWRVRMNATRALGLHAATDALEPLCERLRDPHWRVREAAARALGHTHDAEALLALQTAFWDSHEYAQAAIERAITQLERELGAQRQ